MSKNISNQIDDQIKAIEEIIEHSWNVLENAEVFLSDSHYEKAYTELEGFEIEIAGIVENPTFRSTKLMVLKNLHESLLQFKKPIVDAHKRYEILSKLYNDAKRRFNISEKSLLQWNLVESEYRLCSQAIKFNNSELYQIIINNIIKHVDNIDRLIKAENLRIENISKNTLSDLDTIFNDEFHLSVLDDLAIADLSDLREEISISISEGAEMNINIKYIHNQVEDIKRLLFVRQNQLKILSTLDAHIKKRSSTGNNRYFNVLVGDEMLLCSDYDEYFARSVRAINR